MTKFNVGDRVVALKSKVDVTEGKTYEVVGYPIYGDRGVYILDDVGDINAIYVDHLELAEEYEDETVKQLRKEIDEVKSELGVLAGQVARLTDEKSDPKPEFKEGDKVRFQVRYDDYHGDVAEEGESGFKVSSPNDASYIELDNDRMVRVEDEDEATVLEHVEDTEPKPEFKAGDVVRFKTTYVDFEGEVAEDGEYGEVIISLYNPVVRTDSGAEVLIDSDEVEVSDVIVHVDISESSNESETKDSKTVVVEYDPIEWAEIKPGDVLICTKDGLDVSRGRIYQIDSVVDGEAVFTDDVGDTHYWDEPVHVGINDNVAAFRQRPVY